MVRSPLSVVLLRQMQLQETFGDLAGFLGKGVSALSLVRERDTSAPTSEARPRRLSVVAFLVLF